MRNDKVWLATMLVGALLMGCGDDGEGGVSASKKVGELSDSETQNFCGEVEETFARLQKIIVSVTCTERALEDEQTCSSVRRACIDDPPAEIDVAEQIDFECSGERDEGGLTRVCADVTVGELRSCVDGLLDALEDVADSFTCTSDLSALKPPAVPSACTKLGQRCATLSDLSFD